MKIVLCISATLLVASTAASAQLFDEPEFEASDLICQPPLWISQSEWLDYSEPREALQYIEGIVKLRYRYDERKLCDAKETLESWLGIESMGVGCYPAIMLHALLKQDYVLWHEMLCEMISSGLDSADASTENIVQGVIAENFGYDPNTGEFGVTESRSYFEPNPVFSQIEKIMLRDSAWYMLQEPRKKQAELRRELLEAEANLRTLSDETTRDQLNDAHRRVELIQQRVDEFYGSSGERASGRMLRAYDDRLFAILDVIDEWIDKKTEQEFEYGVSIIKGISGS